MLIITKSQTWVMESIQLPDKLDSRLEMLLNLFEKEVKQYDRLSSIFFLLTPVGVIFTTLSPIPIMLYIFHINPFPAIVSGGNFLDYWWNRGNFSNDEGSDTFF